MGWQVRIRPTSIHAAERVYVEGACTPSLSLITNVSVLFAISTERAKQTGR